MKNMIVRKARVDDAKDIVYLNVNSWKDTYNNIFPMDFLENLDPYSKESIEKCKKSINQYAVCECDNQIVGIVRFGKNKKGYNDSYGEIYALYVDKKKKRKGIGIKLVKYAFDRLKKDYEYCVISTLKENTANNFYKKLNGKLFGESNFKLKDKIYKENVYEYKL